MKKTSSIFLSAFLLYSCINFNRTTEVIVDIQKDVYNDTIHFDKDVNVLCLDTFWFGKGGGYLVDMYFNTNDTLRSAKIFLSTEDNYDQAKYNWLSDTSINIMLYDSRGDSSVSFFAAGTTDGRGSAMGDLH